MAEHILQRPEQVVCWIDQVRSLADAHRRELGFLPESAYCDAAMKGNLWAAIDEKSRQLRGHLLFGGQYPHLKIFQICVRPECRSTGTAGKLISALIRYGEESDHLTISARVSSKLAANSFWKKSGFRITRQTPGKGAETTINVYALDLDVPSLFGTDLRHGRRPRGTTGMVLDTKRPLLQTPLYVIDLNVFFDVVRNRDTGEASQLMSAALKQQIRLFVTPEFVTELVRSSHNRNADPILEFAKTLPTLPRIEPKLLQPLVEKLREMRSSIS